MSTELTHYGVKGMKWGVRKDRQTSETSKRRAARRYRRYLSDGDLDKMVQRLEKEKKLKDLVDEDTYPGKKFVKALTSDVTKRALGTVASGAIVYGVKVALTKEFNAQEAAKFMAPLPKKK